MNRYEDMKEPKRYSDESHGRKLIFDPSNPYSLITLIWCENYTKSRNLKEEVTE